MLWPSATAVDVGPRIPRTHFDALSELGLFAMVVPESRGGLGLKGPEVRSALRILGGGCGATAFAFAQHHGTIGAVVSTANQALSDRWLSPLSDNTLAGIAYAHVRRPGPPVLAATQDGDGWVLNGTAPWVTSWGTAGVFGVAAATADGQMVWALVPVDPDSDPPPGLQVGKSFDLMVFGATQTVALDFVDYRVDPEFLLKVVDAKQWAEGDRLLAARPNPVCLGVGDRALQQLAIKAPEVAAELAPGWSAVVERAEVQCRLVDEGSANLEEVAAARAETLMAVQRLTVALLAASGGAAMERSHPAQRLCREAQFFVIQAQSGDGRKAMFASLIEP